MRCYRNKEWTDSMNCFTKAIRLNKTEPLLYSNRAMCEFNLRKFQLALEDIEYAISLDPKVLDTLVTFFDGVTNKLERFRFVNVALQYSKQASFFGKSPLKSEM